MLHLPYAIYKAFNELLIPVIHQVVDDTEALSLNKLWKKFALTTAGKKLLRATSPFHMMRKLENKQPGDTIPIRQELFVGFIELIHNMQPDRLPAPKQDNKWQILSRQVEAWGKVFLDKYFPEQPELIKHFTAHDEVEETDDEQETDFIAVQSINSALPSKLQFDGELFKKPADERLRTLDKSYFTIEYMQGDMQDYGAVSFRMKAPNIIYGEYAIFYQQKDGTYPCKPEILSMQGLLIGSDIIVLTLINNNIMRTHVCTIQLFYDANFDLKGHYIVDYREGAHKGIPTERKNVKTGEMSYTRATKEEASAYLQKMMEGKKRKNELYNYKGTDTGNPS